MRESRIDHAVSEVRDLEGGDTPPTWVARTIEEERELPIWIEHREIRRVRISRGRPSNGAMRSDDHISTWEMDYSGECPECGHDRLRHRYHAHHHIAGSDHIWCLECEHEIRAEEWG